MKLAWKMFIITYTVVILITSGGIAVLIKFISNADLIALKETAISANNYAVRAFLTLESKNIGEIDSDNLTFVSKQIYDILESENIENIKLIKENNSVPYQQKSYIKNNKNNNSVMVVEYCVNIEDENFTVITTTDISSVFQKRKILWKYYRIIITIVSLFSGVLLFIISKKITKPINKLANAVSQITDGNYGEQLEDCKGSVEISELAESFNIMSTSIKRTTDALKEEAEKQTVFIRNFTHEIKTPMTSIIGYADLLRRYDLDTEEKEQATEFIFNESVRLEKLSMTLTELFLLEEKSITFEKINLVKLQDKIGNYLKCIAEKYNVKLSIKFDNIFVTANEVLLISLINNLVENACKASLINGVVEVFTDFKDNSVIFYIRDNGIGMSDNDMKKIKEPFYMVDKSRSRKSGGSGLGLSLCDAIIKLHNSELIFKSIKNMGTTVSFKLLAEDINEIF